MKTDILTVVDTSGDDSTGFYVNGDKVADVHCNDGHEIPGVLYGLMVEYDIAEVKHRRLTDTGCEKYDQGGEEHPDKLSDYSPEDFA